MKKPEICFRIVKESEGYSATANSGERFMATQAENFEELKKNIVESVNLAFDDEGFQYNMGDITLEYDLESFFDFYRVINVKALSQRIGMNQSLLAQYIRGIKKPSPSQTRRILNGVHQIGRELSEVRFLL
ncbi:MAG: hypothetical protein R6U78_06110 [Bacteroidales bacterium]